MEDFVQPLKKFPYTLKFENSSPVWADSTLSFKIASGANEIGSFQCYFPASPELLKAYNAHRYPTACTLSQNPNGINIFSGGLSKIYCEHTTVTAIFVDPLEKLRRIHDGFWVKDWDLKKTVESLIFRGALKSRFIGNFSDSLSGWQLPDGNFFQALQRLSLEFGFDFCWDAQAQEVLVIRSGHFRREMKLSKEGGQTAITWTQGNHYRWYQMKARYFDSHELQTSTKTLDEKSLYGSLGNFDSVSSSTWRKRTPFNESAFDQTVRNRNGFERIDQQFKYLAAQQALKTQTLELTLFEPALRVGDCLNYSEGHALSSSHGNYWVQRIYGYSVGASTKFYVQAGRM